MTEAVRPITHPALVALGVEHGFGVKGWRGPAGAKRPIQVHGVAVARVAPGGELEPTEADAVLAESGEPPISVVTADCVPILIASPTGDRVGAIHAGWRGLAAGVIGQTLAEWERVFGGVSGVTAVIGPHARSCCYEVDAPVRDAFSGVSGPVRDHAFVPTTQGHWLCDLAALARHALASAGVPQAGIGCVDGACTICGGDRFESFRRDGSAAGRLVHAIAARGAPESIRSDLA